MSYNIIWDDYPKNMQAGDHAVFGASTYSRWRNKSIEEKMQAYKNSFAQVIGTSIHSYADFLIKRNIRLNKNDKKMVLVHMLEDGIPPEVIDIDYIFDNLKNYIQDAIGYKMRSEQFLYYSEIFYGTADAISFDENQKLLRIHDLKTGVRQAKLDQLEVYSALFCLRQRIKPSDISFELRIYQNNDILIGCPTAEYIEPIMEEMIVTTKSFEKQFRR